MKIRIRTTFSIQVSPTELRTYPKGEYKIPTDISKEDAERAVKMGVGRMLDEKFAPETKVVAPAENKAKVARKKSVRGGRPRSKPKS